MDRYSGRLVRPISLNKYLYADSDPINFSDPSGHMSNVENGAVADISGTMNTMPAPNIMSTFAGRAANKLGRAFTDKIEDALRRCLKPGVTLASKTDVPKLKVVGRGSNSDEIDWAMPDFMFKLGDKFKYLEAKTKLPGINFIGDQFERVGKQLQGALDAKTPIGIVSQTKHRDSTLERRKDDILATLTGEMSKWRLLLMVYKVWRHLLVSMLSRNVLIMH